MQEQAVRKSRQPRGTLLRKLIFSFLLLVPIPLAILGWLAGDFIFQNLGQQTQTANSSLARSIAQSVDWYASDSMDTLKALAQEPALQQQNPAGTLHLIDLAMREESILKNIIAIDKQGNRYADNLPSELNAPINYSQFSIFRFVQKTQKPYISNVRQSTFTGHRTVALAVPVLGPKRQFNGVLIGNLDLDKISQLLLDPIHDGERNLYIVDQMGRSILNVKSQQGSDNVIRPSRQTVQKAIQRQSGTMQYYDSGTKQRYFIAFAPADQIGWEILVFGRHSDIFGKAYQLRNLFIIVLGIATLIWLVGIILVSRNVTHPLKTLEESAQLIAAGNYDVSPKIRTNDEVETLSIVLEQMAQRVKSQIIELEDSRERIQRSVRDIGTALTKRFELSSLLQFILERIADAVKCDYAVLFLFDDSHRKLIVKAAYHPPTEMLPLIDHYQLQPDEGIAGWSFTRGIPIIIPNAMQDPRFSLQSPYREHYPIGGLMSVPILYEGTSIGVIDLFSSRVAAFGERELQLVEAIAGQAGVAIQNVMLYERNQRQLREMQTVHEVSQAVSSSLRLDDVLRVGLQKSMDLLEMHTGVIFLLNQSKGQLELRAVQGIAAERFENKQVQQEFFPLLMDAIKKREILVIPDTEKDPRVQARPAWHQLLRDFQSVSLAVIPMVALGNAIGVMRLTSNSPREFKPSELTQAEGIANQLALSVRNAELYEETRKAADALRHSFYRMGIALASPLDLRKTLELITQLAAEQMGTDKSALLMPEGDHMVVRAQVGMGDKFEREYRPLLINCPSGWIAQTHSPLAVENSLEETRFKFWDESFAPFVGSFLGVPVVYKNDLVGVLCIFNSKPKAFTQEEVSLLTAFASQAAIAIENASVYEREHYVAQTFQKSLLPQEPPRMDGIEITLRYYPATRGFEVGGDYYDYIRLSDHQLGIVIADVSGKGINAAVHTAMGKYFLRAYATESQSPAWVLERLNEALNRFLPGDYFITIFYGIINLDTKTMIYASGGHEPQIHLHTHRNEQTIMMPTGKLLGILPNEKYREAKIQLEQEDILILYTDGLSDAHRDNQFFGLSGIQHVIDEHHTDPPNMLAERLRNTAIAFRGDDLTDDVAMVLVQVCGP